MASKASLNLVATAVAGSNAGYELKVNRVPGAGAGNVMGRLSGASYQVGNRYSLSALPDNGYIFEHWSGPCISGAAAERRRLDFVFTETMAASPTITATFVKNPFRDDVVGSFSGLVSAAGGVPLSNDNQGAVQVTVTHSGIFTALIKMGGERLPLTGVFDAAGLGRFDLSRADSSIIARSGHPPIRLRLQLDLGNDGSVGHPMVGTLEEVTSQGNAPQSAIRAARAIFDGSNHLAPAEWTRHIGNLILAQEPEQPANSPTLPNVTGWARASVWPSGSVIFKGKLIDGTSFAVASPITSGNAAVLFCQMYGKPGGSIGGVLALDAAKFPDGWSGDKMWWFRPAMTSTRYPHGWPGGLLLKATSPSDPTLEAMLPER